MFEEIKIAYFELFVEISDRNTGFKLVSHSLVILRAQFALLLTSFRVLILKF